MDLDKALLRTMETIAEHGHEVVVVGAGEDGSPPFAYSVGRCLQGKPELLVTGSIGYQTLGAIVNRVAELYDELGGLVPGDELAGVLIDQPVRIAAVRSLRAAQMFGVTQIADEGEAAALQVLWPDALGRFPGDEGFATIAGQPVYA